MASVTRFSAPHSLFALALAVFLSSLSAVQAQQVGVREEHIVVSGGPALQKWERYKTEPHDIWWGNFIRSARVRMQEIREEEGPGVMITWLVYREGYERRAAEEGRPLISFIESVEEKYGFRLVWFNTTEQLLGYLNNGQDRRRVKVANFEFFGHSNKACFMFDYSNHIANGSKVWLHENELRGAVSRRIWTRNPHIKSWGCHTGESMSQVWRKATGKPMVGAVGKTDYTYGHLRNWVPRLTPEGRWTQ
jgi:hypothetical protein